MASLAVQQGISQTGVREAKQRLGEAILELHLALHKHLKIEDEKNASMVNVCLATVLSVLRENNVHLLLSNSDGYRFPKYLLPCIQKCLNQHPELYQARSYPDWVRHIERDLYAGKIQQLLQICNRPMVGEKVQVTRDSQCLMM